MYNIYATLLDAFQNYLDDRYPNAEQDLIDRINRVPLVSEAAERGTAFNEIIDTILAERYFDLSLYCKDFNILTHKGFDFSAKIVFDMVNYFPQETLSQVRLNNVLHTKNGIINLYGIADEIVQDTIFDIKTTSNYTFPKYLHAWQHLVYCYCSDLTYFTYLITDFKGIYKEDYVFDIVRDTARLQNICERFIDFLEANRYRITDKKIFGEL